MPSRTDDLRLPPLAAIQAFEAAARLGSFEKASEQLCITASAVGKRIAALEEMVGVSLFARSARGLTLSVAGTEYLGQVRAALSLLADVSLHHRPAQRPSRLRLATPPTFARQILIPHLDEFTSRHPDVELEVLLSIPYLDLSPPDTDLEIRFSQGVYAGWTTTRLIAEDVFPVCAPTYLASLNGLAKPCDLARAVLLRSPLEPWRPWFHAAGLDWAEPTAGPRLVDLGMLLEAAVNAQGVALARQTLAQMWLDAGTLVPLFDIKAHPIFFYYLCSETARPVDGSRGAFAAWLIDVCARLERSLE
jgi:LysR family transcriptional regulator, glycine cleavage system transcriptional activator